MGWPLGRRGTGFRTSPVLLEAVVEEFAAHGVSTHRVMVSGEAGALSERALAEVRNVCARRDLDLVFVPHLFAFIPHLFVLGGAEPASRSADNDPDRLSSSRFLTKGSPSPYLRFKRFIDGIMATILLFWFLPLLGIAAIVVILDVGSRQYCSGNYAWGAGWPRVADLQAADAAAPFRPERPEDTRETAPLADWSRAPPVTDRRVAAIAERAGRRHVVDRSPAAPSGGSTSETQPSD